MSTARVEATGEALELIGRLTAINGPLMFHQSGGCCDGSSPMCFTLGEFRVGDSDVLLGEVGGAPFYMSAEQFEYWKHTHLTLDVVAGRGQMPGPQRRTPGEPEHRGRAAAFGAQRIDEEFERVLRLAVAHRRTRDGRSPVAAGADVERGDTHRQNLPYFR